MNYERVRDGGETTFKTGTRPGGGTKAIFAVDYRYMDIVLLYLDIVGRSF